MLPTNDYDLKTKMDFIFSVTPLANLPFEQCKKLAGEMEEIEVSANTIIFNEGDVGDKCYLIREGEIAILAQQEMGAFRLLATLKRGDIFGELALIENTPRNATAKTQTACRMFVISKEMLLHTISESYSTKSFIDILSKRIRPKQISHAILNKRITNTQDVIYTLKDPLKGNYCNLSDVGVFIWEKLDGKHTLEDISVEAFLKYFVHPDVVESVVIRLMNTGFLEGYKNIFLNAQIEKKLPRWIRIFRKIRQVMEFVYFIDHVNDKLSRFYNKIGFLFFTKWSMSIMLICITMGFVAFGLFSTFAFSYLQASQYFYPYLLILIPLGVCGVILHELGHALTTKSFGREVYQFGIGWLWLGPRVVTNTSDMWLCNKMPKIAVDLAGIFTDLTFAGIATLCAYFLPLSFFSVSLWLYSFFIYISILYNLNPLFIVDGYYVLMDLFDHHNLRESSIELLLKLSWKNIKTKSFWHQHRAELCYWIVGILFLIFITYLTYEIQKYVLQTIRANPPMWIRYLLPTLALVLSSFSILAEILTKKTKGW